MNRFRSRAFLICVALFVPLFAPTLVPCAAAQAVDSVYGRLPVFEFHSSFWVNLHHFLYHEARAREAARSSVVATDSKSTRPVLKKDPSAVAALTQAEQLAWDGAIAYYIANYVHKDLLVNIDLILLKNQLGDFEDCAELTGKKARFCNAGLPGNVGTILEAAAPVYRAHWWADQDRANRRWVARVAPLVREQGVGLSERLADIYQAKWPKEMIRVDVSAYANAYGAYTTLDPLRVTISSTDPNNQGPEALEVLFHEASHDIARPVENAIERECRQRDKPIPRDLWHALVFYTTGEVLSPVLNGTERSVDDEVIIPKTHMNTPIPSDLREKITQRGWEDYLHLLTIYWQPYLDGRVTFEDAVAHVVSAL
jgi:hypothetical protein